MSSDRHELEQMLAEQLASGSFDNLGHIKEELDRVKTTASRLRGV